MRPIPFAPAIKVWYTALPKFPQILWPIVQVKLSWRKGSFPQPVSALVDSGANVSILHRDVAEALGFNLKKLGSPKVFGASVSGMYSSWTLPDVLASDLYGHEFSFRFIVINNPDLIWPCILGEESIFHVARLDFQKFKGYFEIRFRQDIQ